MVSIPENEPVYLLVADPTLLRLVFNHFPLAAARHIHFMAQNSGQDQATVFVAIDSEIIYQTKNALSLHVLLYLYCLTRHWFLAYWFCAYIELTLQDVQCLVVLDRI